MSDDFWGKAAQSSHESRFLEGPHGRVVELYDALRIFREFVRGFRALHFVGPCVTVFGSSRFPETHPYYAIGQELGERIADAGFTVMTGGGPGLMESVNRGAKNRGGYSVGCNILLSKKQRPNRYLDYWIEFTYTFVRKTILPKYSVAFVALPGGFGTLDELFTVATLVQTKLIRDFPVVLIGSEFWKPLLQFFRESLVEQGTISPLDFEKFIITDSPEEAVRAITKVVDRQFIRRRTPRWYFGERIPEKSRNYERV